MKTPELVDMLKSGVHFGHQKSKRHPNMESYIFTTRNNVNIIDLEQTEELLGKAMEAAKQLAAAGKTILFVGTKNQASAIVKKYAEECGMPFVENRWLGGTLTNFDNVIQVPRKLTKLKKDQESGELGKYTKKEQLEFSREIEKLTETVGGLETLEKLPDAVFIVDLREEKTAMREAVQMKIPVLAVCDTNVDPLHVEYTIPANDDAVKSIELLVGAMASAVTEGKNNPVKAAPEKEKTEKK